MKRVRALVSAWLWPGEAHPWSQTFGTTNFIAPWSISIPSRRLDGRAPRDGCRRGKRRFSRSFPGLECAYMHEASGDVQGTRVCPFLPIFDDGMCCCHLGRIYWFLHPVLFWNGDQMRKLIWFCPYYSGLGCIAQFFPLLAMSRRQHDELL